MLLPHSNRVERIRKPAYEALIAICEMGLPSEVCGILAKSSESNAIDYVHPIRNAHNTPLNSFAFDPEDWTRVYFNMQKNRQSLVGFFHSHPESEAVPSISDHVGFLPVSALSYWIISLMDRHNPIVQPFHHTDGTFQPSDLVLA